MTPTSKALIATLLCIAAWIVSMGVLCALMGLAAMGG